MNSIRSVRAPPPAVFTPSLQTSLSRRKGTLISFRPITTTTSCSKQPESSMDRKDENPKEKPGDVMSDSFGEGYATRSEEEGFGGIYGGNDKKTEEENHPGPDYDKTQGSEVKEKEKGRHQTHIPN
ncbi:hypothetical protein like AT5G66780 [Hibiscus trionum]|uniref:Late embryogenesis abundant protein n=1 Tax=Hibiscus trionum TaxID=183268 RepID=A0A9W7J9F6_HIBTR|nr:hypothetical protein like AT5G66780 [Hibiscus trionum]